MCTVALVLAVAWAVAAQACSTDDDCFLAGECVAGQCKCDSWATGPDCRLINPVAAPRWGPGASAMGYWNESRASWGGRPILVDGTWHLFAAEMQGGAYLSHWGNCSTVIRAEGPSVTGPFVKKEVVVPSFAHNPQIVQANDGTFLLYYIGLPNSITEDTCAGYTKQLGAPSPNDKPVNPAGPVRLAVSKSIYGPWTTTTILGNATIHRETNPSPYVFPNGTVLLAVCRRWVVAGSNGTQTYKDVWITRASSYAGPYEYITKINEPGLVMGEDPGLFRTRRGFQLLMHSGGPYGGGHFYSHDGIQWKGDGQVGYNGTVALAGGSSQSVCQRQRPQVIMGGPDGMTPIAISNGAQQTPASGCPNPWTFDLPTMTMVLELQQPSSD